MEIHAPEHPIRTWREFAIHIAIVTIGILIALSLEGLRELVHDHSLVKETRENFRLELEGDLDNDDHEFKQVRQMDNQVKALVADLPGLARTSPGQITLRLNQMNNPGYFFSESSWDAALSTGALAHMSTAELELYSNAFNGLRTYAGIQGRCLEAEVRVKAFFVSHPSLTPGDLAEGTERLLLLAQGERSLRQVGLEARNGVKRALGQPEDKAIPGDRIE